jgi:hypothetical protein
MRKASNARISGMTDSICTMALVQTIVLFLNQITGKCVKLLFRQLQCSASLVDAGLRRTARDQILREGLFLRRSDSLQKDFWRGNKVELMWRHGAIKTCQFCYHVLHALFSCVYDSID